MTYNILMYSHDSYGLGHIRRSMAIAMSLRQPDVNILIITGSPIVGRFDFPDRIDFVRVPGMIKQANDLYVPHSIKIEPARALAIRQSIIEGAARAFQPDLFIVDKSPLGLKKEILPTLEWLRRPGSSAITVLGLRDIMDDAAMTRKEWSEKGVYGILDRYYSEIWVYGNRKYYDPVREYAMPDHIAKKIVFTGYIPRRTAGTLVTDEVLHAGLRGSRGQKRVLVTAGGGGDGYPLLDAYLSMLEGERDRPFQTIMVSGPFMAKNERLYLASRARALGVRFHDFYRRMEDFYAVSDLVVCMGGYNTFCEIMTCGKVSLVVPRETPRQEQRIRAEVMSRHGLVDCLPWNELSPDRLRERILRLLDRPGPYLKAIGSFPLSGLEVMRKRLASFRGMEAPAPLHAVRPVTPSLGDYGSVL